MATNYIVDPRRFTAQGAVVDWNRTAKLLGNAPGQASLGRTLQLRWMLRGDQGLPTEPFQVWGRVRSPQGLQKPLTIRQTSLQFFFGYSVVTWPEGSMSNVSMDLTAGGPGVIFAFAGGPLLENIVSFTAVGAGSSTVDIGAPHIDGLLMMPGTGVSAVRGIGALDLTAAAGWVLLETVGLPVEQADWAALGRQGQPQGMIGASVDARSAAVQRLQRGGPPIGWAPLLAPGVSAPPWSAPAYPDLIDEANQELLKALRDVVASVPPGQQAAQQLTVPVPPPQNSAGDTVNAASSDARVSPYGMTLIAAGTDAYLSLALGFGTAYPWSPEFSATFSSPRLDYMITAHWEKGLDGASPPFDLAALVPAPGLALSPPPPANLASEVTGLLKPLAPDLSWRCTTRISWDRPPTSQLFRNVSFAVARAGVTPPTAAEAMLDKRPAGGWRPVAINTTDPARDPLWWRNNAVDRELPIPNTPGSRTVKYAVAVQDLYGQWTPWASTDRSMAQPELDRVRIVSAALRAVPSVTGSVCPATLELEFLWDWSVRTPEQIVFGGRLYPAAEHGSAPPDTSVPSGLARSVGGAQPLLTVSFGGSDTPSAPGATFMGLDGGGERDVGFGPAQGAEGRRYRMSLPGFSLDFGLSGHIGLALWARGQEHTAPQRLSPWSSDPADPSAPSPTVVTASDPRPPVVPTEHVQLGSLPDAAGQSHARIAWSPQPGAGGYFVYESDETQILRALGLPEPRPDQTLDDRLKIILDRFADIPRRVYTRLNATPLTGSSTDVTLPRGSTAIHCYRVLGISAGQVESDWPSDKASLITLAAPHVVAPAPPTLELERVLDTTTVPPSYAVRVRVAARPGPRVRQVELHRVRVDDAARELDTMGPPLVRVQASGGGWTVQSATDVHGTSALQTVEGLDAPPGSWRRVWYRATAWTGRDDTRGALAGRSAASTAAWVVVPPASAPVLSAIMAGGGPGPADVTLEWTSSAPVLRTSLGPHTLLVRAAVSGAPAGTDPPLRSEAALDRLPLAPPAAGASGVWLAGTVAGLSTYRATVRRAALSDALQIAVRLTDPLGRAGEALLMVPAGPVDPPPTLEGLLVHRVPFPPPGRLILECASSAPLTAPPDGPYLIRVTAFPAGPGLPTVIEMPVGSVPIMPPSPLALGLYRLAGGGPTVHYVARALPMFATIAVRITAPDGRFAEAVWRAP